LHQAREKTPDTRHTKEAPSSSKDGREEIFRACKAAAAAAPFLECLLAMAIVDLPRLRIGKHLVGEAYLLELRTMNEWMNEKWGEKTTRVEHLWMKHLSWNLERLSAIPSKFGKHGVRRRANSSNGG